MRAIYQGQVMMCVCLIKTWSISIYSRLAMFLYLCISCSIHYFNERLPFTSLHLKPNSNTNMNTFCKNPVNNLKESFLKVT